MRSLVIIERGQSPMRNLVIIERGQTLRDYIGELWQTPEFQEAHNDRKSFVYALVSRLAQHDVGFFEPTRECEHGHFTTWMGLIALRNHYTNPYLRDLYFVHEMYHLATMEYDPSLEFFSWYMKMHENEVHAALASEVFIYFFMRKEGRPIRQKTFDQEIWADQWLTRYGPEHDSAYTLDNYEDYFSEVVAKRRTVIQGFGVESYDGSRPETWVDFQVSRYAKQNYEWAELWRDQYIEIETLMGAVRKSVMPFTDYIHILQTVFRSGPNDDFIFFEDKAVEFDELFRRNNRLYGNVSFKEKPVLTEL